MLEYILVFFLTIFFSIFHYVIKDKVFKLIILFFLVIIISMIYYFRDYSIGTDTYAYVEYFDLLKQIKYSEIFYYSDVYKVEFIFFVFSKFLIDIFEDFHLVFFIYAIITYSVLIFSFKKLRLNLTLMLFSIFTLFPIFFYNFNILRQSIALSFIIMSVVYLINNENKKFIFWVLLSSLFHSSAIVCLFFYFAYIYRDFLYKYILYIYIGLLGVGYVFFNLIGNYLDKYMVYMEGSGERPFGLPILLGFTLIFILSYFLDIKRKDFSYRNHLRFFNFLLGLFLVYNSMLYILGFSNQGLNRVGFYFMWPIIFIIPILVSNFFKKNDRFFVNFILFSFYSLMFFYILFSQSDDIIPFKYW